MLEKNLKVYWKGFDVGKCRCTSDLDEFYLEFQTNSVKKNIIYSTIENSTFISFYSNQNGIIKQSEMTIEKNKISFSGSNEAIIYKGNLIPYEMIIYKLFPPVFNTHYVKVLFIEEKNIGYIPIKTYGKNILCLPNATIVFDENGILEKYLGHMNNLTIK